MAETCLAHNDPPLTILTGTHTGLCLYLTYQRLVLFATAQIRGGLFAEVEDRANGTDPAWDSPSVQSVRY